MPDRTVPLTGVRALASWCAAASDQTLGDLFAARGVSPTIGWHDFYDAAEALLDPGSVDRALIGATRDDLAALCQNSTADSPATIGLVSPTGTIYPSVAEALRRARRTHPDAFAPPSESPTPPPSNEQSSAAAAEEAFVTLTALAEILLAARQSPLSRTAAGTVTAADRKALEELVLHPDALDDLLALLARTRLLVPMDRLWCVSEKAEAWLHSSTTQRWTGIVDAFRAALPSGLRTPAGGYIPPAAWLTVYPLDKTWPDRSHAYIRDATRLGLIDSEGRETQWGHAVRNGAAPKDIPAPPLAVEVEQVYLQADLTAVAPGHLTPELDLRLRTIAERESRSQATTFRFTANSVHAGFAQGETAATIMEFLGTLSLTGVPQPLEYLIDRTAERHGTVRIRVDDTTGHTLIDTDDPALREAIAVDSALRPLALVADGPLLRTRVAIDAVHHALADARYPVGAPPPRASPSPAPPASAEGSAVYAALIASLRTAHGDDAEQSWLHRELERAVRDRARIIVTVRLAHDETGDFHLEASGIGGGRLRGLDHGSDVERTLPLSHVVAIRPDPGEPQ